MDCSVNLDNFIAALSALDVKQMSSLMMPGTIAFFDGKKHTGLSAAGMIVNQVKSITGKADCFLVEMVTVESCVLDLYEQIVAMMKLTLIQGDIHVAHHFFLDILFSKEVMTTIVMIKTVAPRRFVEIITTDGQHIRLMEEQIFYVKAEGKLNIWFTEEGVFEEVGSLSAWTKVFSEMLLRMGKFHVINLAKVDRVENGFVILNGDSLKIPHGKIKYFKSVIECCRNRY